MLTKNDFTVADWNTLRDTQYLVGLATLVAESSGLGTIKESIALAQGIVGNQASEYPFIRDMTSKTEMEAAQASLRQRFGGAEAKPSKDALQQTALEQVRASMSILRPRRALRNRTLIPSCCTDWRRRWRTPRRREDSWASAESG